MVLRYHFPSHKERRRTRWDFLYVLQDSQVDVYTKYQLSTIFSFKKKIYCGLSAKFSYFLFFRSLFQTVTPVLYSSSQNSPVKRTRGSDKNCTHSRGFNMNNFTVNGDICNFKLACIACSREPLISLLTSSFLRLTF